MIVETQDAGHLRGEVRIAAGLPGLRALPGDPGLPQHASHGVDRHDQSVVLAQVAHECGEAPGGERLSQPVGVLRAMRQIWSRAAGPNLRGRPPLHFGSSAANPDWLNAWITSRTWFSLAANIIAISPRGPALHRRQDNPGAT
jgi:hypothetical protein